MKTIHENVDLKYRIYENVLLIYMIYECQSEIHDL